LKRLLTEEAELEARLLSLLKKFNAPFLGVGLHHQVGAFLPQHVYIQQHKTTTYDVRNPGLG
jgi:hypothetical protein